MSQYNVIETQSADLRTFTLVAKASGSPITSGTVTYYLKCLTGVNFGKWWRKSNGTWQAAEEGAAMTNEGADGVWSFDPLAISSGASPFTDGVLFIEYAKESGSLHIPVSRTLLARYTPSASSTRRTDVGLMNGTSIAGTGSRVADSFVAMLNIASPVFTVASVNQTGDAFARIGANGVGLTDAALANLTTINTNVGLVYTRLGAPVGASIAADIAGISASIEEIEAAGLVYVGPVHTNGDVVVFQGDDHKDADGTALEWTLSGWPSFAGGTMQVAIYRAGSTSTFIGACVSATLLRLELTAAQLSAMTPAKYEMQIHVTLANGDNVTPKEGHFTIRKRIG